MNIYIENYRDGYTIWVSKVVCQTMAVYIPYVHTKNDDASSPCWIYHDLSNLIP